MNPNKYTGKLFILKYINLTGKKCINLANPLKMKEIRCKINILKYFF